MLKPIFAIKNLICKHVEANICNKFVLSVYMLKPMSAIRDTFPLLVRLCSTCTDQQGITGRLTTGMSYLVVFTKKNILSILKTIAFEAKIEVYQQFLVFTTQSIGRECNTQRWSGRRRVL